MTSHNIQNAPSIAIQTCVVIIIGQGTFYNSSHAEAITMTEEFS